MTLTVVWSAQARNQFVATLTYIAKEEPTPYPRQDRT